MIETELKIALDAAGLAGLRRHPALSRRRRAPRRTLDLLSVYYDTPGHALAAADISLRLRRVGQRWVQTVKRRSGGVASSGLFAHEEAECPAPGGRLVLSGPDPEGAIAAVVAAADGAPLAPIFETRVRRVVERLGASNGGEVELALDEGEIRAGGASVAIREAELELAAGDVHAVFEIARELFPAGPIRFASENKAARGYRLVRGEGEAPLAPRHARTLEVEADATVETVAGDVFRDCLAQIADNMAVVAASEDPEGPHQLRVGLRRLRTAFALFGPSLGKEALKPLSEAARRLGRVVGELRDADVLVEEVVRHAAEGLDSDARAALDAALQGRRAAVRARVREALSAAASVGFLFDLAACIEGRGWLAPSDYSQSERLAARIADVAPAMLAKRYRKVKKLGRRIRELDAGGLHKLRKELKKLRYAVDMLGPVYREREVAPYLKKLKELQDCFGSMNDAAMAREALAGPEPPVPDDPAVQRGVGWVLGTLSVKVAADRPNLFERWHKLAAAEPFWT